VSKQKKDIPKESLQFQAETRQLLDIVTHSLYTEKEVFLRELVSNASDALEKLRHLQVANVEGMEVAASDVPLEIRIETDEVNQTLTITDTGVGLTRQDMISNLGTIAKSGSKAFLNEISNAATSQDPQLDHDPAKGIIGKFGVGFYSAFMVGNKVDVRSR
jgi:HSP90 family molecular chaperone